MGVRDDRARLLLIAVCFPFHLMELDASVSTLKSLFNAALDQLEPLFCPGPLQGDACLHLGSPQFISVSLLLPRAHGMYSCDSNLPSLGEGSSRSAVQLEACG